MMVPAYVSLVTDPVDTQAFVIGASVSLGLGILMIGFGRGAPLSMNTRQLYLVTTFSWILVSVEGALPLMWSNVDLSLTDAVFEATSGVTTTGSTILSGLQEMGPSLLLWRSMLQWLGGIGVIGMGIAILPFLRVGGMRLFRTESSDWSDKTTPRFQDTANILLLTYIGLTVLCGIAYWMTGMQPFNAINHAFTTISTGGYSTDDRSMGQFGLNTLWIGSLFMLIGGMPFTVLIRVVHRPSLANMRDEQVKVYLLIVAIVSLILTADLLLENRYPPAEALTHAVFNVDSIITTTGYASTDYSALGPFALMLFLLITFIGGCSGSTSGGMNIFRFQLSYLMLRNQLRHLVHPAGIFTARYNGRVVDDDIIHSAVAFSFLFFITFGVISLLLAFTGLDLVTSFTAAATALTNVGPGLGPIIGPAGNFAPLPESAKWLLAIAMILGRLELLSMMVVLSPVFWRG